MVLLSLFYLLIVLYEWRYLSTRGRKRKTYVKVFAVVAFAFCYNAATMMFTGLPDTAKLLSQLFGK